MRARETSLRPNRQIKVAVLVCLRSSTHIMTQMPFFLFYGNWDNVRWFDDSLPMRNQYAMLREQSGRYANWFGAHKNVLVSKR